MEVRLSNMVAAKGTRLRPSGITRNIDHDHIVNSDQRCGTDVFGAEGDGQNGKDALMPPPISSQISDPSCK